MGRMLKVIHLRKYVTFEESALTCLIVHVSHIFGEWLNGLINIITSKYIPSQEATHILAYAQP